ncbi:hypothetical protein [Thiosocius teredinicola]|uniref:hypothetical protein n=1 Tax=Thiosocius teredinicola TaxID=1973002 RepID=UPI000F772DAD
MDRIAKEIQRQGRESWLKAITKSKFAIGFVLVVLAVLAWNIYKANDRVAKSEKKIGRVVGIHQFQGNTGSAHSRLSVQLKNGQTVLVQAPVGRPIRSGSLLELSRVETEQGSVYYRYVGYVEGADE